MKDIEQFSKQEDDVIIYYSCYVIYFSCIDGDGKKIIIKTTFDNTMYLQIDYYDKYKIKRNLMNEIFGENQEELVIKRFKLKYKDYKIVQSKKLFGFQDKEQKFIFLRMDNIQQFDSNMKIVKDSQNGKCKFFHTINYEHSNEQDVEETITAFITPIQDKINIHIKFLNELNVKVCSWVEINDEYLKQSNSIHNCDKYFEIENIKDNIQQLDINKIPPYSILSYDIETTTHNPKQFPNPKLYSNKIVQIGLSFQFYNDQVIKYKNILLVLGPCKDIPNVEIYRYKTELSLLKAFYLMMKKYNPDITIGYNIFGFDDKYIRQRKQIYEEHDEQINKLELEQSRIQLSDIEKQIFLEFERDGSNIGQNQIFQYNLFGQIRIDLLHTVREQHKLNSYKLDNVSQYFIKGKIKNIDYQNKTIITDDITGLLEENYFIMDNEDPLDKRISKKIRVKKIEKLQDGNYKIQCYTQFEDIKYKYWQLCKDDIPPSKIFEAYQCTDKVNELLDQQNDIIPIDEQLRTDVAKYCSIDCYLVLLLQQKLKTVVQSMLMARTCNVPYRYIFQRAQSIKLQSFMLRYCIQENILMDKPEYPKISVEGAIVLEAEAGHYKYPVTVYDFESLYPSCIITYNLCPTTYIHKDDKINLQLYRNKSQEVKICKNDGKDGVMCIGCNLCEYYYFVKQEVQQGLFPKVLKILLSERKRVKGLMKDDTLTQTELLILDSQQLALKVTANSLYGLTGASVSPLYCPMVARSTTFFGRKGINDSSNFMKTELQKFYQNPQSIYDYFNKYNMDFHIADKLKILIDEIKEKYDIQFNTVYGDSVAGYTPLILRNKDTKQVSIKRIDQLSKDWISYDQFKSDDNSCYNKQQNREQNQHQIFVNNQWINIKRVIRHKTNKIIYRVNTNNGLVDVTEDHSLIDENMKQIKPGECNINTLLRQNFPQQFSNKQDTYSEEQAYYLGYQFGKRLNRLSRLQRKEFCEFEIKHLYSSNFNEEGVLPNMILNQGYSFRKSFINGYCYSNRIKTLFKFSSQIEAAKFYYLLKSIDKNVRIDYVNNNYELRIVKYAIINNKIKRIQKLRETSNQEYVYDIETEVGLFNGGIGELVLKNTDSVFIYPTPQLKEGQKEMNQVDFINNQIEQGKIISTCIKKIFAGILNLQYEKVLANFFLFSKKHYISWLHEDSPIERILFFRGIVLQRRDNPDITKYMFRQIYKFIDDNIYDSNLNELLIDKFMEIVKDIIKGKFPLKDYVISKTLAREYKNPDAQCHYILTQRLNKKYGIEFLSNERIPYIITYDKFLSNHNKVLLGSVAEHPDYFNSEQQQIDQVYYLQNMIKKPLFEFVEKILIKGKKDNNYIQLQVLFDKQIYKIYRKRLIQLNDIYKNNKDNDEIMENMLIMTKGDNIKKNQIIDEIIQQKKYEDGEQYIDEFLNKKEKQKINMFNAIQVFELQIKKNKYIRQIVQFILSKKKDEYNNMLLKFIEWEENKEVKEQFLEYVQFDDTDQDKKTIKIIMDLINHKFIKTKEWKSIKRLKQFLIFVHTQYFNQLLIYHPTYDKNIMEIQYDQDQINDIEQQE